MTLDKVKLHKRVKIVRLGMCDQKVKRRLQELGFIRNQIIEKIFVALFNDPIVIKIRNYSVAISVNILKDIEVCE